MNLKINNLVIRRWRLRVAQLVAPAGADVHDPDETSCLLDQDLLEAVFWNDLLAHGDGLWLNVTEWIHDLRMGGLAGVDPDGVLRLTDAGERELDRLWGPHRVPPWSGGYYACYDHGIYDAGPGELLGCPSCAHDRAFQSPADRAPAWWPFRRLSRARR